MVDDLRSALFDDHATVHEDDLVGEVLNVMLDLAKEGMTMAVSYTI